MWTTTFRILIQAQTQTVWKLLLEQVENPQMFQPMIRSCKVLERFPHGVIREVVQEGAVIREGISIVLSDYMIKSELMEHPLYNGSTYIRIFPTSVQNPMAPLHLEIGLILELKEEHRTGLVMPEEDIELGIRQQLQAIKQKAEEIESRETEPVGSEQRFRSPMGGGR